MGYLENLLGRNEQIVIVTRKHWITLLGSLLINGFIAALLAAISAVASFTLLPVAVLAVVLMLYPLVRVVVDLVQWWNEQYVVTNRRVIQLEGFIRKRTTDSSLEKINDVKLVQSALGRLLDYGDLEILTASEIGINMLRRLASPVRFKTEMLDQKESMGEIDAFESKVKRTLASEAPTAGDIPELIAELDELRKKGILTDAEFEAKKTQLLAKI
jgi:uncharacterized membrane protein YdbT with pleckstrin-like domain